MGMTAASLADSTEYADILAATRAHLNKGRASLADIIGGHTEVKSAGPYVYLLDGRRFLECGGYGVFILGHCHPAITEAVIEQVRNHPLATRVMLEPTAARAAQAVADVTPQGLEYVHFTCSGSEASEVALKLARSLGKRRLVSAQNGFHGKTMGALSVSARRLYQEPFEPLLPNRVHVPFGETGALEAVLAESPGECCVFLEPVQGEGGVIIPPPGYLQEARQLCDRYGAFLVFDEIQTGFGRCGRMWASEYDAAVPDVMLVGKGLSGGVVPVAAAVATPEAYDVLNRDPALHSSTFACSPIAMAAAVAAVRTIVGEDVPARAEALGGRLLDELRHIVAHRCSDLVHEVRGVGLLLGIEFVAPEISGDFILELFDRGIIMNYSIFASNVTRLTPPVCLSEEDIDWLLSAVDGAAEAISEIHSDGAFKTRRYE